MRRVPEAIINNALRDKSVSYIHFGARVWRAANATGLPCLPVRVKYSVCFGVCDSVNSFKNDSPALTRSNSQQPKVMETIPWPRPMIIVALMTVVIGAFFLPETK